MRTQKSWICFAEKFHSKGSASSFEDGQQSTQMCFAVNIKCEHSSHRFHIPEVAGCRALAWPGFPQHRSTSRGGFPKSMAHNSQGPSLERAPWKGFVLILYSKVNIPFVKADPLNGVNFRLHTI